MALTWYRHFQRNGGLNQILRRQGYSRNALLPLIRYLSLSQSNLSFFVGDISSRIMEWVAQQVPIVEQKWPTLPEHPALVGFMTQPQTIYHIVLYSLINKKCSN
jgi:hypothetical protein